MSTVISEEGKAETIPSPQTSGYMLSVKISSHPALDDGVSSNAYNITIVTIPLSDATLYLTYLWGDTDITSVVDGYLDFYPAGTGEMPTVIETGSVGTYSFQFTKDGDYADDHTFKITISSLDVGSSVTTAPF